MPGHREEIEATWVHDTRQCVGLRLEGGLAPLGGDRPGPGTARRPTFRDNIGLDEKEKLLTPRPKRLRRLRKPNKFQFQTKRKKIIV